MRRLAFASAALAGALSIPALAAAQTPQVLVGDVACIPRGGNGLVRAIAGPLSPGAEVRIYFRRHEHGDFYWLPARQASDGTFWAVLPVPEPDNVLAEVYGAVYGPGNMPLAQSRIQSVEVREDCPVDLDAQQAESATNMTVGETALGQKMRKLAWWQCPGVEERIDVHGERREDEACLPLAAWWQRPEVLGAFLLVPPGITIIVNEPEPPVSPANP
jgi:hypothetical protein